MKKPSYKAIIVVPTCRPDSIYEFLDAWKQEFADHKIIVTEDSDKRQIDFTKYPNVEAYSASEWAEQWGKDAWIFPRGNAGHRAFGFWKAWEYSRNGECDMIVTLDDDCFPDQELFLDKHYKILNQKLVLEWTSSVPEDWPFLTRGFPYNIRDGHPVMINHGLWSHVPDFDAPTQLLNPDVRLKVFDSQSKLIPWGTYFPFCGMNVAWKPEATPLLYFLLMGKGWPYDRFDDIWAGIFAKKICDQLRWCITTGTPSVRHTKLSNVFANLKKETSGIVENEKLWEYVHACKIQGTTATELYSSLGGQVSAYGGEYFTKLGQAMQIWAAKFH